MNLTTILLSLSIGCSDKNTDTAEAAEDTATDTDTVIPDDTDLEEEDTVVISGVALWADGAPADGATIQVCAALCRRTNVSSDGSWGVEGLEKEKYIILGFSGEDTSIATTVTLIDMQEDRNLDPMVLYPYATSEAWGTEEQEYALDAGLTVTFDGSEMEMGLYAVTTTSNISSVHVAPDDVPVDFPSGEPLAMWMLGEFDYQPTGGISWTIRDIPTNLDIEDGATLEAFLLDNEAHAWSSLGTYTVADGMIVGEANLTGLSTLVLVTAQ